MILNESKSTDFQKVLIELNCCYPSILYRTHAHTLNPIHALSVYCCYLIFFLSLIFILLFETFICLVIYFHFFSDDNDDCYIAKKIRTVYVVYHDHVWSCFWIKFSSVNVSVCLFVCSCYLDNYLPVFNVCVDILYFKSFFFS